MKSHVSTWTSAFGPFTAIVRDDVVVASGWTTDVERLLALITPRERPSSLTSVSHLGSARRAVDRYDNGDLDAVDTIAVHQTAGPFHSQVHAQLRAIRPGGTLSYAMLAAAAGRPRAARAAGTACARNAASLFVPCHRAIGTNGTLHAFGWGLDCKARLLAHEVRFAAS